MFWQTISQSVTQSASFKKLFQLLPENRSSLGLTGPAETGKALIVSSLLKKAEHPLLWLLPTEEEAERQRDNLTALLGEGSIKHWAAWDVMPGEEREPDLELLGSRIESLEHLFTGSKGVVISSARALMQKTMAAHDFNQGRLDLALGQKLDRDDLISKLVAGGYERQSAVSGFGEYAVRGSIIDVATLGNSQPLRLEISDETLASMRTFGLSDQLSTQKLDRAKILPCREDLNRAVLLLDHLPKDSLLLWDEPQEVGMEWRQEAEEVLDFGADERFCEPKELTARLEEHSRIIMTSGAGFGSFEGAEPANQVKISIGPVEPFMSNLELLEQKLNKLEAESFATHLLCDNTGQQGRLKEILTPEALAKVRGVEVAGLHAGFIFPEGRICAITEREIFARERHRRFRRFFKGGSAIRSLDALKSGDYMVHVDYGICQYKGLVDLELNGQKTECLLLFFRDNDKLYVPIEHMKRVQRYSSEEGFVPVLSKLGSKAWEETKARVKKAAKDMAGELVALYAQRKSQPGHRFSEDTQWQKELEASFMYQETPDQLKALTEIKADMESDKPMDRLLCGDVGYGKTEVALRAAFKAAMDNKQVAVLVPTTVLCEQHYQTFKERLADYPVKVEMLSRFRRPADIKEAVKSIAAGGVDIAIGTHRLLQKDVKFKNLGLLVVDEEQRFGVGHKEKIKQFCQNVDVLTMTATPIPRTLHMSLLGVRDISNIETPPKDRLAVVTEMMPWNEARIKEAVLRELDRGGQVFFLHNRVQSIGAMTALLSRLLPSVEIAYAHGQMDERELESVMLAFTARRYDVLVATTIIESGLDMPNVNTIIINRADRFGLAQLYQLRGRVGRSSKRAYAYMVVPKGGKMTDIARKRLRIIEELSELGSGFQLALRDLEIRGAGNLLGREQNGHMLSVGFDMYCQLLEEAVRELKGLPAISQINVTMEIEGQAIIPADYVEEPNERINLYRRLNKAADLAGIERIAGELKDRFGEPPGPANKLLEVARLRLAAASLGADRLVWRNNIMEWWWPEDRDPARELLEKVVSKVNLPLEFVSGKRFMVKMALGKEYDIEALAKVMFKG
ncbi:transcription-repair coupling factor [candidate division TA06 bacterium]|nr:transcription-repair coupling factor [candidate division TA06 bacterium]